MMIYIIKRDLILTQSENNYCITNCEVEKDIKVLLPTPNIGKRFSFVLGSLNNLTIDTNDDNIFFLTPRPNTRRIVMLGEEDNLYLKLNVKSFRNHWMVEWSSPMLLSKHNILFED